MESVLDETLSLPTLEEGVTETETGGPGNEVLFTTTIELLDEMENQDGQLLQEMYRIQIVATWVENGQRNERMVETWRYGRMYQSS